MQYTTLSVKLNLKIIVNPNIEEGIQKMHKLGLVNFGILLMRPKHYCITLLCLFGLPADIIDR